MHIDTDEMVEWLDNELGIKLDDVQREKLFFWLDSRPMNANEVAYLPTSQMDPEIPGLTPSDLPKSFLMNYQIFVYNNSFNKSGVQLFESIDQQTALLAAQSWLNVYPNDIVMLVEAPL